MNEKSALDFFSCVCCGSRVSRPGAIKCQRCAASPKALRRVVEHHSPLASAWARMWRYLPSWQEGAKTYAYARAIGHQARMFQAAKALKDQRKPLTVEGLTLEIDRREIGCARMAAHRERPEVIYEARQSVSVLRAMRAALGGGIGDGNGTN